jgi:copper homeostasis protein
MKACVEKLNIPSVVMLRPRGGNFIYNNDELDILKYDIEICNNLKPYRIILGILDNASNINYKAMQQLINLSNVDVAMHRAFDEVIEKYGINYALEQIKKLADIGIKSLLSAGGKGSALSQIDNLNKLLLECNKYNIEFVAAGKITKNDLSVVLQKVPARAFHGRDIVGSIF